MADHPAALRLSDTPASSLCHELVAKAHAFLSQGQLNCHWKASLFPNGLFTANITC